MLSHKNSRNSNIPSSDCDVRNLIKWLKKIVEQISKGRCKEKISVFKTVVDPVTKKIFSTFPETLEFCSIYHRFSTSTNIFEKKTNSQF